MTVDSQPMFRKNSAISIESHLPPDITNCNSRLVRFSVRFYVPKINDGNSNNLAVGEKMSPTE